jgi:multidrug resistance protein, MATE family
MIPAKSHIQTESEVFSHKSFLMLAVPLILSTLTTPILGAVDTAVVGHLGNPAYIGGVAVGTLIFNTLYWLLGFLRVSTSGFAAQAHGARNEKEIQITMLRPFVIAAVMGMLFIALQVPIKAAAIAVISPTAQVALFSEQYFDIRIWGAPFALANYVVLGWLIGTSRVKVSLYLQVFMNVLNIILNFIFVYAFGFGVAGVAAASLISEVLGAVIGISIFLRIYKLKDIRNASGLFDSEPLKKMLRMNRDLLIRTACLLAVFTIFTTQGAKHGDVTLSANAIILQLQFIAAYFLDGIANAASILTGKAIGEKNEKLFKRSIRLSAIWAFGASVGLALILFIGRDVWIGIFTSIHSVQSETMAFFMWIIVYPLVSFWGLQLHGIFSGATEAGPLRDSMMISLAVFLISIWLFIPLWGNHGLWLAFILFSLTRSLSLWPYLGRLRREKFL